MFFYALFIFTSAFCAFDLGSPLIEAKKSEYTEKIIQLYRYEVEHSSSCFPLMSREALLSPEAHPVVIHGIRNPKNSTYIGTHRQLIVEAPLESVASTIENFEKYSSFLKDLKVVRCLSKESNKITTFWERFVPVFFMPNIKYEMVYLLDRTSVRHRIFYRYQLKSSNMLSFSDGLIILTQFDQPSVKSTFLEAVDFFDARWGLVGSVGSEKIWHDSLEGSYQNDVIFKTVAEHPDWTLERRWQESQRLLKKFSIDSISYISFPPCH